MTVYFFLIQFLQQFIVFLMTLICILVGLVLGVTIQGISLTPDYVALTLTYYLSLENTELTRRLPSLLAARYSKQERAETQAYCFFLVFFGSVRISRNANLRSFVRSSIQA